MSSDSHRNSTQTVPAPIPAVPVTGTEAKATLPSLNQLEAQEYELIRQVMREEHGAIRRSAARLGISHQALLRRLKRWPELRQAHAAANPAAATPN